MSPTSALINHQEDQTSLKWIKMTPPRCPEPYSLFESSELQKSLEFKDYTTQISKLNSICLCVCLDSHHSYNVNSFIKMSFTRHLVHLRKSYNSMVFSMFIGADLSLQSMLEHFHHPKKALTRPLTYVSSPFLFPSPRQPSIYFSFL